ncbi:MAG: hypothetical protein ACD_39C00232G0001 [uncultured bacterium]|nr:MAG: hypothetical protein ACD_39C00232G0001 [uncultured bacterium]
MNSTKVSNIFCKLLCVILLLILPSEMACCCDNSMLELLTGSSSQESVSAKLLVISSKMQVTATHAQSFNHAAAEKMHHEVMESWLYVASQITSNPPGAAADNNDFHPVIVLISRDLGSIRQQILQRQLEDVHDQLEICVSRMSLLAAMINGHLRMRDFLRFELLILSLRPKSRSFVPGRDMILSSDFLTVLDSLGLHESPAVMEKVALLKKLFLVLRDTVSADQNRFSTATLTSYLALYNEFAEFKKLLLSEKYF